MSDPLVLKNRLLQLPKPSRIFLVIPILLFSAGVALAYGQYVSHFVRYIIPGPLAATLSLPRLQTDSALAKDSTTTQIVIPKINVQAPIIENVPLDDQKAYDEALKNGVALGQGTASLDSLTGNSFIFGHSSAFSLHPSPYDAVFSLLPQLKKDDQIQLIDHGKTVKYSVTLSKSVSAKDVQYAQSDGTRTLTLATCYPIGLNIRRWVVQATRVD